MATPSRQDTTEPPVIIGLGEALFDVFPDRQVLGGAPLNVAVHAHQIASPLGGRGVVVSRIGDDELGRAVQADLASRDMTSEHVQVDLNRPTGRVNVTLTAGEPAYDIERGVAWDAMELPAATRQLAAECSAVCFGTLAQRREASRQAIYGFLENAPSAIRMFDVNLRQDYFSREIIEASCSRANAVKLNEEELPVVARLLKLGEVSDEPDALAQELRRRFQLKFVALTRGPRGTVLFTADERIEGEPVRFRKHDDADSVGAGDACSAGLLLGEVLCWPRERTVQLANTLGAFVASVPGATPQLSEECLRLVGAENSRSSTDNLAVTAEPENVAGSNESDWSPPQFNLWAIIVITAIAAALFAVARRAGPDGTYLVLALFLGIWLFRSTIRLVRGNNIAKRFTISDAWLLLALRLNHDEGPSSLIELIRSADKIRRAIPNRKQLDGSLNRLLHAELIHKTDDGSYDVTQKALEALPAASDNRPLLQKLDDVEQFVASLPTPHFVPRQVHIDDRTAREAFEMYGSTARPW